jgi:hypothetical protein
MTRKATKRIGAALALSVCMSAAAQSSARPRIQLVSAGQTPLVIEKAVPAGGTVALDVNVGDVKLLPSTASGRVRLEIVPNADYGEDTVRAWVRRYDVTGDYATIDLNLPKTNHGHSGPSVTLYVPAQADLRIDLGVGDLHVDGIRGDKDLHVGVGDLTIGLDPSPDYGHVEIATHIGDVNDPLNPGRENGFLGKNEDFVLKGRFRLHATVGVGDINLVQHPAS